jgi:hypothetical protein
MKIQKTDTSKLVPSVTCGHCCASCCHCYTYYGYDDTSYFCTLGLPGIINELKDFDYKERFVEPFWVCEHWEEAIP